MIQIKNINGTLLKEINAKNLCGANLHGADLHGANLPSPTMVLLANWQTTSDSLCLELMRYDAENHENPMDFINWKKTKICPYQNKKYQRSANFTENEDLMPDTIEKFLAIPVLSAYTLMNKLIAEKCKIRS